MRSLAGFIGFVSFVVGFISCQKEVDGSLPGTTAVDTVYLKKYVEIDTTLVPGSDTTLIRDFQYDGSKRISRIVQQEIDHAHTIHTTTEVAFFYNGTGTNPYKFVDYVYDNIGFLGKDTVWFFYDVNNLLIKDSLIAYSNIQIQPYQKSLNTFTSSGNNTFIRIRDSIYNPFPSVSFESHQGNVVKTYANGNIATQTDTTGSQNKVTDAGFVQLTYDSRKNPFYKTDIHYPVIAGFNPSWDQQKNNFTEIIESAFSVPFYHLKYVYTYRSDEYPLIVRITDIIDPSFDRKGFFFY